MTNLLEGDWVNLGESCTYFALNEGLVLHGRNETEGLEGRHVDFDAALKSLGQFFEVVKDQKRLYLSSCFLVVIHLSPVYCTIQD